LDTRYAHCSQEEFAGSITPDPRTGTFVHLIDGACKRCVAHAADPGAVPRTSKPNAPKVASKFFWTLKNAKGKPVATHYRKDHASGTGDPTSA